MIFVAKINQTKTLELSSIPTAQVLRYFVEKVHTLKKRDILLAPTVVISSIRSKIDVVLFSCFYKMKAIVCLFKSCKQIKTIPDVSIITQGGI
jgi:hypothetical protein